LPVTRVPETSVQTAPAGMTTFAPRPPNVPLQLVVPEPSDLAVVTVSVSFWVAAAPTPLTAFRHSVYVPAVPAAGVPARVAVLPRGMRVRPAGGADFAQRGRSALVIVWVGKPVVVTMNGPAAPTVNAALLALVNAGDWPTVSVKRCVAAVPTPLAAF